MMTPLIYLLLWLYDMQAKRELARYKRKVNEAYINAIEADIARQRQMFLDNALPPRALTSAVTSKGMKDGGYGNSDFADRRSMAFP